MNFIFKRVRSRFKLRLNGRMNLTYSNQGFAFYNDFAWLSMGGYDHNCCGKCLIKESLGRKPWQKALAQLGYQWL